MSDRAGDSEGTPHNRPGGKPPFGQRLFDWWRRRGKRRRSDIEEIPPLTEQFYTTLKAERYTLGSPASGARSEARAEVERLLGAEEKTWRHAYEVEQLLVGLYDEDRLTTELKRRVLECKDVLGARLFAWYSKQLEDCSKPDEGEERRVLLARLVNDLQWRYMVNEVKRSYSKTITRYTGWIFVAALALFCAWAVLPYTPWWAEGDAQRAAQVAGVRASSGNPQADEASGASNPAQRAPAQPGTSEPDRDGKTYLDWVEMQKRTWYLLFLAGFAGAWGASFSMLTGLKGRLESAVLNDLKLMRPPSVLLSRPLIGLGAAFILYFFVASGLLSGSLFPDFTESGAAEPIKNLALLVVWSFLAGFSEKLVPGLLARTEERIAEPRAEAETGVQIVPPGGGGAKPPPASGGGTGGEPAPADAGGGDAGKEGEVK